MVYPKNSRADLQETDVLLKDREGFSYFALEAIAAILEEDEDLPENFNKQLFEYQVSNSHPQEPNNAAPGNGQSGSLDLDSIAIDDIVALYFREMSQVPLLTWDQEVNLAKKLERARQAKYELENLRERGNSRKRRDLRQQVQDGVDAREHLIRANTRLVVSVAKKYLNQGLHLLDLVQEGNLGLMKAIEKYDYHKGFRFSTYAHWWIRQTITRSIADQSRTIRLPVHMSDRIRKINKTARQLEQSLGRPPSVTELAEELDMDPERIHWTRKVSRMPVSLETPIGDDEDTEFGMLIEDEKAPHPSQVMYQNMLSDRVNEILSTLSPREARILRLRYGLEQGRPHTLEEVGRKFGLTRERIRQIEVKALRRLRHPSRSRRLREYL